MKKNPMYRHNALTALVFIASPLIPEVVILPPDSLHPTEYLPHIPQTIPSYKRLKARARQHLLEDWGPDPAPKYYPCPRLPAHTPSWA